MRHTLEYGVWETMKSRCYNPNSISYGDYGGRGISVCDRWKKSFANFYADMGPRPTDNHSIERKDNNKNYDPSNCVWATSKEQEK